MLCTRVTQKIAKKIGAPLVADPPPSTGKLGDWYANLLIIRRQHLVLCVSERTLLPIVMPARDLKLFPHRLSYELEIILKRMGIPEQAILAETAEMLRWSLAKTASRQVLGSMNDLANLLDAYLDDGASLLTQSLRLARSPCSPLGMDSPLEATGKLFGVRVPPELYRFDLTAE